MQGAIVTAATLSVSLPATFLYPYSMYLIAAELKKANSYSIKVALI